jgi:hypothetical protein
MEATIKTKTPEEIRLASEAARAQLAAVLQSLRDKVGVPQ